MNQRNGSPHLHNPFPITRVICISYMLLYITEARFDLSIGTLATQDTHPSVDLDNQHSSSTRLIIKLRSVICQCKLYSGSSFFIIAALSALEELVLLFLTFLDNFSGRNRPNTNQKKKYIQHLVFAGRHRTNY